MQPIKSSREQKLANCRVIRLAPLPNGLQARMSSTVQLNDHRIAYAATFHRREIYVYDIRGDEWHPYSQKVSAMWSQRDGEWDRKSPRHIAYDSTTKMLYWASESHIAGVNTVNDRVWRPNKWKPFPDQCGREDFRREEWSMLSINGDIHFVSGYREQHKVVSMKS